MMQSSEQPPQVDLNPAIPKTLSRRTLLLRSLGVVLVPDIVAAGILGREFVGELINEQLQTWRESQNLTPETAMQRFGREFQNISFGTTFVPEDFRDNIAAGIEGLRFLVQDLGIRHMRVAIRQNTVVNPDNPHVDYYQPFFTEMMQLGVTIDLCIGVKTPVYPESHLDDGTKNDFPELKGKEVVKVEPDSALGERLLSQTGKIARELVREYPSLISHIGSIQPSNEPFSTDGAPFLQITPRYLEEEVLLLHAIFPGKTILLNCPGTPDGARWFDGTTLNQMQQMAQRLQAKGVSITTGYDYYQYTDNPSQLTIPTLPTVVPDSIMWVKLLSLYGTDVFNHYLAFCSQQNITPQVTELAWEHWGQHYEPETSFQQFIFELLRTTRNVLDLNRQSVISLWGSTSQLRDRAQGKLSQGQLQMFELIRLINANAARRVS